MLSKNKVKEIRKLHRKKGREAQHATIAEGEKVINELLEYCPEHIQQIYISQGVDPKIGVDAVEVDPKQMKEMSLMETPPGILAVMEIPDYQSVVKNNQGVYLYLDGIRDPGNMGTIVRTALWFGVTAIFCSPDCVESFSPKVVQSSMGAIFRIPVVSANSQVLGKNDDVVYGAVMDGDNLNDISFTKPCWLVIGNESNGISSEVDNVLSQRVTIPGSGAMESLNAATATAIILSRIFD